MREENTEANSIPRLAELSEFRYQLRAFLSFSEAVVSRLAGSRRSSIN